MSAARTDVQGLPPRVPVWLMQVAARANRLGSTSLFGLKTAGGSRPLSYDTLGIRREGTAFYAVSVCRDGEGYPRRLIDYGVVDAPQQCYAVPAETDPVPKPTEQPAPSPEIAALTARIEALEDRCAQLIRETAAFVSVVEAALANADPSQWEAAGKVWGQSVTLLLRKRS